IEIAVVTTGFLLGGSVGVGTVLYALSIGPLAQFFLRFFAVPEATAGTAPETAADAAPGATAVGAPDATPGPGTVDAAVAPASPEGAILRR
ncbi:hypothetical protein ACFTZM_33230, partial [Streptomyces hydrogenans]